MAIDCDPQAIATDASCFTCQGEKQLLGMAVYLLAQQLSILDPMAALSPQELAIASNCYTQCLSGKGLLGAMVFLLCQIENNGGGGGGGNFRAGSGVPAGNTPGALRTAYLDDDTGVIWVQNPDGTWSLLP